MQIIKQKSKQIPQPLISNSVSYSSAAIQRAKLGCYDKNNKLFIDGGYGDYNMSLFRLKDKRRYMRDLPSIFTPAIKQLIKQSTQKQNQECDRIATQHNQQIQKILAQSKQTYVNRIKAQKQKKKEEDRIKNQYIKGQDIQVRQFQEQLSFNYLPIYQAQKWFKIRDNISTSLPPLQKITQASFRSPVKIKNKKRKGHIFLSDSYQKINKRKR